MSASLENLRRVACLGPSRVSVAFPDDLAPWFGTLEPATLSERLGFANVAIAPGAEPGTYRVDGDPVEMALGEALATSWERLSFMAIDGLKDAFAIHGAALTWNDALVSIPGSSGAGKTRLALWLRQRGFRLAADEVLAIAADDAVAEAPFRVSTLARPLMVKAAGDLQFAVANEAASAPFSQGFFVNGICAPVHDAAIRMGLLLFASYQVGAPLRLTVLDHAQAALRLMGVCVNARNLPRGGLGSAAAIARRWPAIEISYGDARQLDGVLDVLLRQILRNPPSREDLDALCTLGEARHQPAQVFVQVATPMPAQPIPAPTVARFARSLTIGMATYDDYDGAYFTIQAIRIGDPDLAKHIEFVVIDNNPTGASSQPLKNLEHWVDGYRYIPAAEWCGTAVRDRVFAEATSDNVLCLDSHVLIRPGAIARLIAYMQANPGSRDLLQGPLVYDDLKNLGTHFDPIWREGMYGVWGVDPRGEDVEAPPFDIPMQGLGVFACRRAAWPGFNPAFRGFGGEEGYIHEKFRQRGGRTLCLPFLRWLHRFNRPMGTRYTNRWEDRIRNYYIGRHELGLPTNDVEAHFSKLLGIEPTRRVIDGIMAEIRNPSA
jgi:Glycosyl transferase family 2